MAERDAWLHEIDPMDLFHRLFDLIPGMYFFAKNRRGELMFSCRATRNLYHITDETGVIGLTDFDLNPPDMAQPYVNDDERIYPTGQPLLAEKSCIAACSSLCRNVFSIRCFFRFTASALSPPAARPE